MTAQWVWGPFGGRHALELGHADGCTPQNVLKASDDKLYIMHILPQLPKKRNKEQKVLAMPPPPPGRLLSLLLPLGRPRGWGGPEEEQKWMSKHLLPGSAPAQLLLLQPRSSSQE